MNPNQLNDLYLAKLSKASQVEILDNHFFLLSTVLCSKDAAAAAAKLLQSCLTLCDPIDGSPPGNPVPGILQARTLEWVDISFPSA